MEIAPIGQIQSNSDIRFYLIFLNNQIYQEINLPCIKSIGAHAVDIYLIKLSYVEIIAS